MSTQDVVSMLRIMAKETKKDLPHIKAILDRSIVEIENAREDNMYNRYRKNDFKVTIVKE